MGSKVKYFQTEVAAQTGLIAGPKISKANSVQFCCRHRASQLSYLSPKTRNDTPKNNPSLKIACTQIKAFALDPNLSHTCSDPPSVMVLLCERACFSNYGFG